MSRHPVELRLARQGLVLVVQPHRLSLRDHLLHDGVVFLQGGPRDADRVLVLISGTHGVEGYCGSGAQVDLALIEQAVAAVRNLLLLRRL